MRWHLRVKRITMQINGVQKRQIKADFLEVFQTFATIWADCQSQVAQLPAACHSEFRSIYLLHKLGDFHNCATHIHTSLYKQAYANIFEQIAIITLKAQLLGSTSDSGANVCYKMCSDKIDFDMCLVAPRRTLERMRTSVISDISDLQATTSGYDLFMI